MKNSLLLFLISTTILFSCKNKTIPTLIESGKSYYGEKISAKNAISYDALLKKLETQESIDNIKVKGTIDGVCQAKGCWMNMVSTSDKNAESMFVKFKDYGFFMPLDASGSTVIVEGRVYKEETSVEELRHYAEDEGQSAEQIAAITKPVTELKFMAYGVILE